jgi:hypothetical protein
MALVSLSPEQIRVAVDGIAALQRRFTITNAAASDASFAPLLNQELAPASPNFQAEQAGLRLADQLLGDADARARVDGAVAQALSTEFVAPEVADKVQRMAAGEGGLVQGMLDHSGIGLLAGPDIVFDPPGGPPGGFPRDTVCCRCILGLVVLTAFLDCLPCVAAGGYAYFTHCA